MDLQQPQVRNTSLDPVALVALGSPLFVLMTSKSWTPKLTGVPRPFVLRTFPSKWPKVEVDSSLLYKKPVHIKSRRDSDTSNRAGGMVI